jgi:uncharacterized DUF497 family protein
MDPIKRLEACTSFDWDEGNLLKNWEKHRVAPSECEQVFFNQPFTVASDDIHSTTESRLYALGRTDQGRFLFLVITIRGESIRVISARDMNKRERKVYESS